MDGTTSLLECIVIVVVSIFWLLTIFNEGACFTLMSIFYMDLNSCWFDREITLESVHGTNHY